MVLICPFPLQRRIEKKRGRKKKRPLLFGQSCNGAYCMFCGWLPKFYVQSLQPSLKICRSSFAEVSKSNSQSQVKQVQIWHILGFAGFYTNFILQKYWHLSPLQIPQQKLSVYPILHFVDFDGEFILDADAKLIRFAASLMNIKAKFWPWSFVLAEFFLSTR